MRFGTDYWSAVDKRAAQHVEVSPKYIGMSTHPMRDQLQELKTRVFSGAANVELGFGGKEKGARAQGGITPGMFGKEEREAMRNVSKINEVNLTTHASINTVGFAGMAEGGFKPEVKETALNEVKRAVDFAADVTQGGPVVIHTGEFPRPITQNYPEFETYPEEKKKAPVYLIDERTGQMTALRRDIEVAVPIYEADGITPKRDPKTRELQFEMKPFRSFEEQFEKLSPGDKTKYDNDVGKYFYDTYMKKELELNKGEIEYFDRVVREQEDNVRELKEKRKGFEGIIKSGGDIRRTRAQLIEDLNKFVPKTPEVYGKFLAQPELILDQLIEQREAEKNRYREIALSYGRRTEELAATLKHTKPIEEVGVKESAETIARAGIFAWDKEKAQKLEKPLFIAPENLWPESGYGSHPEELRNLIVQSRKEMAKKLEKERNISEDEAKQIAKDHIKATFDIGHAYTWKKFFKGPSEKFDAWVKDQVAKLTEDGIIGHVHLSDNFGYYDEHLAPGEGHVPTKEFVEQLKLSGFEKPMIVEAGAQPEGQQWRAMTGAWRTLNSPIYRVDGAQSWTDIEQSYFGRTGSPNYVVGGYAPSKDWTLWSGVQLE